MSATTHSNNMIPSVACAVVTVSDTRTCETDKSGPLIRDKLKTAGHRVIALDILPDDPIRVAGHVRTLCGRADCQAVLLSGGTGLAARDTTYEALTGLLDKRLDGFGELFRMLSFDEIGSPAMLSRAVAGVSCDTAIFSMPGSTAAVRLAMDRLIVPELGHIVALLAE